MLGGASHSYFLHTHNGFEHIHDLHILYLIASEQLLLFIKLIVAAIDLNQLLMAIIAPVWTQLT